MTDEQLISYCRLHCTTERALFHADHINRMLELAGHPDGYVRRVYGWISVRGEMAHLCDLAEARMKARCGYCAQDVADGCRSSGAAGRCALYQQHSATRGIDATGVGGEGEQPSSPSPKPVAWVPIHPRTGPLWSMTTDKPDPERLPGSYPLRPLVFADGVQPTDGGKQP